MDSLDTMDRGWNGVCGFLDNPGISIVSKESVDTMEILGLSRGPHTPSSPLSEYLWTP